MGCETGVSPRLKNNSSGSCFSRAHALLPQKNRRKGGEPWQWIWTMIHPLWIWWTQKVLFRHVTMRHAWSRALGSLLHQCVPHSYSCHLEQQTSLLFYEFPKCCMLLGKFPSWPAQDNGPPKYHSYSQKPKEKHHLLGTCGGQKSIWGKSQAKWKIANASIENYL